MEDKRNDLESKKNFALRFINSAVCEPMNEDQLQESERRINIIRNNQTYSGLIDYPKIKESLIKVSESLLLAANDEKMCLGDIISLIRTNQSIIDIHVAKLREEYKKEGEKISGIINSSAA